MTTTTLPTVPKIAQAITSGLQTFQQKHIYGRYCGRYRIYVAVYAASYDWEEDQKVYRLVEQACKSIRKKYLTAVYGTDGNCIYIGYNNATCRQYSQGEQVAANLNAIGIGAYCQSIPNDYIKWRQQNNV